MHSFVTAATRARFLICDSHDVQYQRTATVLEEQKGSAREWRSLKRQRRAEIGYLKKADLVLAISERDAEMLKGDLGPKKVLTAPSGFRYSFRPVRCSPVGRPLRFGFFGNNMEANELALQHALDHWWGKVAAYSPESRLYVAGSVCSANSIKSRVFLNESVELLGFVKSISDFFEKIDVLLSPVIVSGGLNFKNAEAVAAGVQLFTNALGAETLQPLIGLSVVDDGDDLVAQLIDMERRPATYLDQRQRLQECLLSTFAPDPALREISEGLKRVRS